MIAFKGFIKKSLLKLKSIKILSLIKYGECAGDA